MTRLYTEKEVREIVCINKHFSRVVEDYQFNNKIKHVDARTDPRIPEALKRFGEFPEIFVGEINYLETLVTSQEKRR